jgi:hypothetical protein
MSCRNLVGSFRSHKCVIVLSGKTRKELFLRSNQLKTMILSVKHRNLAVFAQNTAQKPKTHLRARDAAQISSAQPQTGEET